MSQQREPGPDESQASASKGSRPFEDEFVEMLSQVIDQATRKFVFREFIQMVREAGGVIPWQEALRLRRHLRDHEISAISLSDVHLQTEGDEDIHIDETELVRRVEVNVREVLDSAVERAPDIASMTAEPIAQRLIEGAIEQTRESRTIATEFETRLAATWETPLALYMAGHLVARELGMAWEDALRSEGPLDRRSREVVALELQVKACRITREIEVLMRSGFADGAMSRWRTMHELSVVARFIAESDDETAHLYRDHEIIETYRMAKRYQERRPPGYAPIPDAEMEELEAANAQLLTDHEKGFKQTYGWAVGALSKPSVCFADIESAVGFDLWRPHQLRPCRAGPVRTHHALGTVRHPSGPSPLDRHVGDPPRAPRHPRRRMRLVRGGSARDRGTRARTQRTRSSLAATPA